MVFDFDKDNSINIEIDSETGERSTQKSKGFAQETVLELIENEEGNIVLRDAGDVENPLLTIAFSDKVQDMLGSDIQFIGHQMVHAAIQAVMKKQVGQWHANVYDEEPEHFS